MCRGLLYRRLQWIAKICKTRTGEDQIGQGDCKKGLHKRLCNPGFKTQLKKISYKHIGIGVIDITQVEAIPPIAHFKKSELKIRGANMFVFEKIVTFAAIIHAYKISEG